MKKIFTILTLLAISLFITETYSQDKHLKISGRIQDDKQQPIAFATAANIIDHIVCNREDRITQSGVIKSGISDHFITYCTRKQIRHTIGQHKTGGEVQVGEKA